LQEQLPLVNRLRWHLPTTLASKDRLDHLLLLHGVHRGRALRLIWSPGTCTWVYHRTLRSPLYLIVYPVSGGTRQLANPFPQDLPVSVGRKLLIRGNRHYVYS
jgi:hypothetical protein